MNPILSYPPEAPTAALPVVQRRVRHRHRDEDRIGLVVALTAAVPLTMIVTIGLGFLVLWLFPGVLLVGAR